MGLDGVKAERERRNHVWHEQDIHGDEVGRDGGGRNGAMQTDVVVMPERLSRRWAQMKRPDQVDGATDGACQCCDEVDVDPLGLNRSDVTDVRGLPFQGYSERRLHRVGVDTVLHHGWLDSVPLLPA